MYMWLNTKIAKYEILQYTFSNIIYWSINFPCMIFNGKMHLGFSIKIEKY